MSLKEFKDVFSVVKQPHSTSRENKTKLSTLVGNIFAAGMSIDYAESIIIGKNASKPHLATNLSVGKRFFSAQVVNVASATPDQLTTQTLTKGAFRLLVFSGNVAESTAIARLQRLARYLNGSESIVSKYTSASSARDSVVDVITIRTSFLHGFHMKSRNLLHIQIRPRGPHLGFTTSDNRVSSSLIVTAKSLWTMFHVSPCSFMPGQRIRVKKC